jgi:hypothetical protein
MAEVQNFGPFPTLSTVTYRPINGTVAVFAAGSFQVRSRRMKCSLWKSLAVVLFCVGTAVQASPVVVENWASADSSSTGTYADSNGSSVTFSTVDGQKKDEKAIRQQSSLKTGGYCGIWHTLNAEVGKATALVFTAKSEKAADLQVALKDKNNVQYVATCSIPVGDWSAVTILLSAFTKDPYYTPPDAIVGKPVDFTTLKGMNLSPQTVGDTVVLIGAVTVDADAKAPVVKKAEAAKDGVVVESWAAADSSNTGVYADSNGSTVTFVVASGPKDGTKALKIDGELKPSGYMGVWHNLGADLSKATFLRFQVKGATAGDAQIVVKDKNNVQYIAPFKVSDQWAEVLMPTTDFKKDPYYTPPDAIVGKPMDLTETKSMNFSPQTPGKVTLWVGEIQSVAAKK